MIFLFFGSVSCFAQKQNSFVIEDVTLIDGTGKAPEPHMRVMVENGKITSVAGTDGRKLPKGVTIINGSGKFLIPGLWDMHVHLVDVDEVAIPVFPAYGITSVRDMGGDVDKLKRWRSMIASRDLIGPRIKLCGPMLEGKWDPQWAGGRTDHWSVMTVESARSTVDKLADAGVDCIKMRGFASPETYLALADEAKKRGIPLVGHSPGNIDPIAASNAGQRTFEHGFYPWPWATVAPEKKLEIEDTFRKNSSMIVPTFIAWEAFRFNADTLTTVANDIEGKSDPRLRLVSPALRKNWRIGIEDMKKMNTGSPGWNKALDAHYEQIKEMHDRGVGIMAGTDTGTMLTYPGAALHQEIKLLVNKAHFTPMDALLTATIMPAKYAGMENDLGTIAEGKLADMVLLDANPIADISNIDKIDGVMLNGRWLDRAALDQILRTTETRIAEQNKGMAK